ncbi:MAG: hypothetical protein BWX99_02100 [Deltaproteobacteria bacterium ADurb.Bin151]|nr:MAG: hypothetical protein BWX99_02100 [Deltaproteobacteria bacterium ADurb.Bin151]
MCEKPLLHELIRSLLHFRSIQTAEAAQVPLESAANVLQITDESIFMLIGICFSSF